jgi:CMP-N,N'-diacetyllegionaminic acid synthase
MKILITICARGGSKGIPGKNIKLLNGKPLIGYSIDVAKQFQAVYAQTDIILSTDAEEIAQVAQNYGLNTTYRRPKHLATDSAGKIDAIQDILLWKEKNDGVKYDYILDLDVTSPLRNLNDICAAFDLIKTNTDAINLFSVSVANRNPYFNMVEQKENGFFSQIKKLEGPVQTRQSAPKVYDLNASFYFYRRSFFAIGYKGAITDKSIIYETPHICFDLDHSIDFEMISFLIENDKLDFNL